MPDERQELIERVAGQVIQHFDQLDLPSDLAMAVGMTIFVAAAAEQMKVNLQRAKRNLHKHADLLAALKLAHSSDEVVRLSAVMLPIWNEDGGHE